MNYTDRNNNTLRYNNTVIPNDGAALAIHILHNNKVVFPYQNMQGLNNKTHQIYMYTIKTTDNHLSQTPQTAR